MSTPEVEMSRADVRGGRMGFLDSSQRERLVAVCDVLVPGDSDVGAVAAGAVDYIDTLLSAFEFDPPRIWARGPHSGRTGGSRDFANFTPLSRFDELAWRTRIEGSLGIPERERLGPVVGLQQLYAQGLEALGEDFTKLSLSQRSERLRAHAQFAAVVYDHVCEGMYGAPEYGGNRQLAGWAYVGYEGDVQPRGYSPDEVRDR